MTDFHLYFTQAPAFQQKFCNICEYNYSQWRSENVSQNAPINQEDKEKTAYKNAAKLFSIQTYAEKQRALKEKWVVNDK